MKDSLLFEMLMNFFEENLSRIQEDNQAHTPSDDNLDESQPNEVGTEIGRSLFLRAPSATALRVFTDDEKIKWTKASYQFLVRLMHLEIIETETMEFIIHQLVSSDSRFVTLQETKWTIRNVLAESLDEEQLAFLDLVLYQEEDKFSLH